MSKEHKDKIALTKMGARNPMFGKKQSPETIEKRFAHRRGVKRPPFSQEWKDKMSIAKLGKPFLNKRGEKSNFWKGGVTPLRQKIHASLEYRNWRRSVFERDNYTCQFCGERGGNLEAHHIRPFALFTNLRFDVPNGITLCEGCHSATTPNVGKINFADVKIIQ